MSDERKPHGPQVMTQARPVKMNPKVVLWIVLSVGTVAFISFAAMFLDAGFRNGWW